MVIFPGGGTGVKNRVKRRLKKEAKFEMKNRVENGTGFFLEENIV